MSYAVLLFAALIGAITAIGAFCLILLLRRKTLDQRIIEWTLGTAEVGHFVSESCKGEHCHVCSDRNREYPATHKVGEEVDPADLNYIPMHNLTAYCCCRCFRIIMGNAAPCKKL